MEFPVSVQIGQFKLKEEGFGNLHGRVLPKGHTMGRPWEAGEATDRSQELLETSDQELAPAGDSVGYYLEHVRASTWGWRWCACVSLRSLQVAWPNKRDAKAAIPWGRLAKLMTEKHCGNAQVCTSIYFS